MSDLIDLTIPAWSADLTAPAWSADLTVRDHESAPDPIVYIMLEDGSGYLLAEDGSYILADVGIVGLTALPWDADITVTKDL